MKRPFRIVETQAFVQIYDAEGIAIANMIFRQPDENNKTTHQSFVPHAEVLARAQDIIRALNRAGNIPRLGADK